MDETFGIGEIVEGEQKRVKQKRILVNKNFIFVYFQNNLTSGLIIGHSKQNFLVDSETILILQDKSMLFIIEIKIFEFKLLDVLDDDDEEVLINPNLLENERHKRNVELRKRKSNYQPYEQELDEFGQVFLFIVLVFIIV